MEPFLGQVCFFAFMFTPRGWHECDGAVMSIAQNNALFALLGTQFGGDGRSTFALPKIAPIQSEHGAPVKAYIALEGIFPSRP